MEIATYAVSDDGSCIPVKIDLQTFQQKYSDRVIIFIIEKLRRVFIWVGKNASVRQKFISSRVAQQLRMELGLGLTFKVRNIEQGMESTEFLEALKNATVSKADVPSPVDHVITTEDAASPTSAAAPLTTSPQAPPPPPSASITDSKPKSSRPPPITTPPTKLSEVKSIPSPKEVQKRSSEEEPPSFTPTNLPTVSGIYSDYKSYLNAWYSGPIILRKAVKLLSTKEMGDDIFIQHISATSFPVNQSNDISWWLALFVESDDGNIKDCRESSPVAIIPFNSNHTSVSLPIPLHVEKGKAIYVSFTNPTYLSLQFKRSKDK